MSFESFISSLKNSVHIEKDKLEETEEESHKENEDEK
jgi:hypothetical protein